MTKYPLLAVPLVALLLSAQMVMGQSPRFRTLVFYSTTVEGDHVQFAKDALAFFSSIAVKDQFEFIETSNWGDLNETNLKKYQLAVVRGVSRWSGFFDQQSAAATRKARNR